MPFGGCWTIPLGSVLDSFSFSVLMGILAILGVAFHATGWALDMVGAPICAFACALHLHHIGV